MQVIIRAHPHTVDVVTMANDLVGLGYPVEEVSVLDTTGNLMQHIDLCEED